MKKDPLFYLICLTITSSLFSMQPQTPNEMVLYNNDLLNLIVPGICLVNQCILKDVHHDLASLKRTCQQLSAYSITSNYHQNIIDLLQQYSYTPTHIIARQLRFPTITQIQLLKKRLYQPNGLILSEEELQQCNNTCYNVEALRIALAWHKGKLALQLLSQIKQLPPCHEQYCNNKMIESGLEVGGSVLGSGCPLVLATHHILNTHSLSNEVRTDLLKIVELLLNNHHCDPNHCAHNKGPILEFAIQMPSKELAILLLKNGADPYKLEDSLFLWKGFLINDLIWARETHAKIQQKKLESKTIR